MRKEKSNPQYRRTKCRIVECSSPKCVSLFDWTAKDFRYTSRTFYIQPESRSDAFCHSPRTNINSAMEQVMQLLQISLPRSLRASPSLGKNKTHLADSCRLLGPLFHFYRSMPTVGGSIYLWHRLDEHARKNLS